MAGDNLRVKTVAGSRQGDHRALQISARGEVRRRAAQDADRQDPALQIARAGDANEQRSASRPAETAGRAPKGYANGVVATGRQLFIAGQIGWNAQGHFETDDFVAQVEQALQEYRRGAAGRRRQARAHRAAELVYHRQERNMSARQREIGEAYRRVIGRNFPAMTLLVVAVCSSRAPRSKSKRPPSCRADYSQAPATAPSAPASGRAA